MSNGRALRRAIEAAQPNGDGGLREVSVAAPIRPSPVPMSANLAQFQAPDGSVGVVLELSTPVGTAVYFLTPDGAQGLGEQLLAIGAASGSGIVVP